nr:uracil-DNA glycosylase [Indiicoccus explosivorum]
MRINCFQCVHFYVTWEAARPRACRAYGFKTKELPSAVVRRSSGMDCMQFKMKEGGGKR